VTLRRYRFRISLTDDRTQDALARETSASDAADSTPDELSEETFTHWMDAEWASQRLAACSAPTDAAIDAMAPVAQFDAVRRIWRDFGLYWQGCNVRCYGWSIWRRICEESWGDRSEMREKPATLGAWRREAARRAALHRDGHATAAVNFGWGFASRSGACDPGATETGACMAPTGEVHRVWLAGNCDLGGDPFFGPARMAAYPAHSCPPEARSNDGWLCDGLIPWVPAAQTGMFRNLVFYGPPLVWYARLLRSVIPGLRVGAKARDLFRGEAAPGDLSVLEYLAALGPEEVVREVRRDVTLANNRAATALGRSPADLVGLGDRQAIDAEARDQRTASAVGALAQGAATSLIAVNPVLGLAAGLGVFVGRAIASATSADQDDWPRDVFGVRMIVAPLAGPITPFQVFRVTDFGAAAVRAQIEQARDRYPDVAAAPAAPGLRRGLTVVDVVSPGALATVPGAPSVGQARPLTLGLRTTPPTDAKAAAVVAGSAGLVAGAATLAARYLGRR